VKRTSVAFLLNFLLPGAGLAYLGKWRWAIINLAVVLLVGILAAFLLPEDIFDSYIRYVALGCAGGSGALAQQLAAQMNREVNNAE
jgi:TM2 domain-containing membrane protein YozV